MRTLKNGARRAGGGEDILLVWVFLSLSFSHSLTPHGLINASRLPADFQTEGEGEPSERKQIMHSSQRVCGPFQVQPERGPLPGPPETPSFPASLSRLRACDLEQESHMAGWVAGGGFGHPVRAGLVFHWALTHTHTRLPKMEMGEIHTKYKLLTNQCCSC